MRAGGTVITVVAALAAVLGGAPGDARAARPACAGERATKVGTARADRITGTNRKDVIVARGGADRILGRGGDDLICAGPGNDTVAGGRGNDRLIGDEGNDVLLGEAGADYCLGWKGRDRCDGGSPTDGGSLLARDLCEHEPGTRPGETDIGTETRRRCTTVPIRYSVSSATASATHSSVVSGGGDRCDRNYRAEWTASLAGRAEVPAPISSLEVYYFKAGHPIFKFTDAQARSGIGWERRTVTADAFHTNCPPGEAPKECHRSVRELVYDLGVNSESNPVVSDPVKLDWNYGFPGIDDPNFTDRCQFVNGFFSIPSVGVDIDEPSQATRSYPLSTFAGDSVVLRHTASPPIDQGTGAASLEATVTLKKISRP